ncbi:MAG: FAD-dependent oxidoreductase [Phycisphaerales bacterium]
MTDPSSVFVVVVGGGVSGLTSAVALAEAGFRVRCIARESSPDTTSDVAAAFWYPYRASPRDRVAAWGAVSYSRFRALAEIPESGVVPRSIVHRYESAAPEPWWNGPVEAFEGLRPTDRFGAWVDGYRYRTYLAESRLYLPWLRTRARDFGVDLVRGTVTRLADLARGREGVTGDGPAAIVNCAGVFAGELADDPEVFPIRGQVLRIRPPAGLGSEIRESVCTYVVPRSEDVILGGTSVDGDWSRDPVEATADDIVRRCAAVCPELLADGPLDVIEHRVGLRPGRDTVRLEVEDLPIAGGGDVPVVHNYGHAGAGYTLSWGCAAEVVDQVRRVTAGRSSAMAGR